MATKVQKPCKICGKMFTPCADCENDKTMFHWRRVACSPECAREYFAKIEETRQVKSTSEYTQETMDNSKIFNETEVTDSVKPKRIRKKNDTRNEESEQID